MISRTFNACRREARFTLNSFANSLSGGNFEPGTMEPSDINCLILAMSLAVTRVSAVGSCRLTGDRLDIGTANYRHSRCTVKDATLKPLSPATEEKFDHWSNN